MELIKFTSMWVKGEVKQGKIMLSLGSIILFLGIAFMISENKLFHGMLIPIGLIVIVLVGYGGMQVIVRPKHIVKLTNIYNENPGYAIEKELQKSNKDDSLFKLLKKIWPIGMILSIALYFLFPKPYSQGMSIGFLGLFVTLFLLDSFLHQRLKDYLKGIKSLL